EEVAAKGKERIGSILAKQVDKGKMAAEARLELLERIIPCGGVSAMAEADIVVEAATENFDVKQKIFRDADAAMKKNAILASNTSSISITKLAGSVSRPDRVIGMHFMNPVPLMKLVE